MSLPIELKKRASEDEVIALYTMHGASHLIMGRIRVLIVNDDGSWFAHGLEADYSAEGNTLPDVQRRFESGLALTLKEHLKVGGNPFNFFRPAPDEYLKLYDELQKKWCLTFKRKIEVSSEKSNTPDGVMIVATRKSANSPIDAAELEVEYSTEPEMVSA